MDEKSRRYASHWSNVGFQKIFLGFKKFILRAECDFAQQCARIIKKQIKRTKVDILEIGAGDGVVSQAFLTELATYKLIQHYTAFDKSKTLVDILRRRRTSFMHYSKKPEFFCEEAEHFIPNQMYDLIIAFNSWYGISLKEVQRYAGYLRPRGILCILLNSKQSITLDLTAHFVEKVLTAEDMISWLTKNCIRHKVFSMRSNAMSKNDFISKNVLQRKALSFYRYLLRKPQGSLFYIIEYISRKQVGYFQIPQKLIII